MASASANSVTYFNQFSSTDPLTSSFTFDGNGSTSCGSTVDAVGSTTGSQKNYRDYAFRNVSGGSDCLSVLGESACNLGEGTLDMSIPLDATGILGADRGCDGTDPTGCGCPNIHLHSFTAPAGLTFIERVLQTSATPSGFALLVEGFQGNDVAPVKALSGLNLHLPGGNVVGVSASSLLDGTGVQGSLTAQTATSLNSGPVRCLRTSGNDASLVMTITSRTGLAAKWAGAVYWFQQSQDGASDGQRNSLLTQQQLDTKYASCPDPTKPVTGSFHTLATARSLHVVDTPPPTQTSS